MPSIADNVRSMAALVAEVKKDHRLTENTVMRIIDMNFALAQSANMPSFSGEEGIPDNEGSDMPLPFPAPDQLAMFEDADIDADEEDVLATVEHKELN